MLSKLSSGSQTFLVSKSSGQLHIKLDWWSTFDIAGNYSDVTVVATIIRGRSGYNTNSTADLSQIFINGHMHESRSHIGGSSNSQNEIARATQRVYHNEDGTKVIEIGFKHWFNVWWSGSKIGEQTFVMSNQRLDDIPRLSDFSIQDTIVMGTTTTIHIAPKADIFDHRIRFKWFNKNDMINDYIHKSIRQQEWTPSIDYANDVPNSTSSWGTLVVETWLNGVYIGEKTKAITLIVPDSVKPTFSSVTLTDMNTIARSVLNTSGYYVQSKSNIKVTYNNAKGAYNSNVVSYRSEIVGTPHYADGNGSPLGVMYMSGDYVLKSYVLDSRGRQSEPKTTSIKVLEYHAPIGSFLLERGGTEKDKAIATITSKVAPLKIGASNKNKMKIKIYSSLAGGNFVLDTEKTTTAILEYVNQALQMRKTYPANQTYTFKMEIWDRFTELENITHTVAIETLEAEAIPFALHPHGFMVNTTEVKGAANIKGDVYIDGASYFAGRLFLNSLPIQAHQLTQDNGRTIPYNKSIKDISKSGFYYIENGCPDKPDGQTGYCIAVVFSDEWKYFKYITFDSRNVYDGWKYYDGKLVWNNSNSFLGNGWDYTNFKCPNGTNLGEYLKSDKVPIGFSVVRDDNTNVWRNILVVKESGYWIFGITVNSSRFDVVTVTNGVYGGYRGWGLP